MIRFEGATKTYGARRAVEADEATALFDEIS